MKTQLKPGDIVLHRADRAGTVMVVVSTTAVICEFVGCEGSFDVEHFDPAALDLVEAAGEGDDELPIEDAADESTSITESPQWDPTLPPSPLTNAWANSTDYGPPYPNEGDGLQVGGTTFTFDGGRWRADCDITLSSDEPEQAPVIDGYHLDAERIGELLDEGKLGPQLGWLRDNDYPVPVSTGRKARTAELLSAISLGDYDAGAADKAFGPLKWTAAEEPAKCPECGSETPEDCEHELP